MRERFLDLAWTLIIWSAILLFLGFSSATSTALSRSDIENLPDKFSVFRIEEPIQTLHPSALETSPKHSCLLQHDNGAALTFFPNWKVADKNAVFFDAQSCGVPQPYPFQIKTVEFLLYNHAGVESTQVRLSVWTVGTSPCTGPQSQIYSSPLFTVTEFYPNWTTVNFPDDICVNDRFFFVLEYAGGVDGSIPGLVSDTQQGEVDSCYQWLWHSPYSPPWREWNAFWNDPEPGWLMLRLSGETYSLVCDTGWQWLGDNGYAPSGAPDIADYQNDWVNRCGPVAMENGLAWFGLNATLNFDIPDFTDTLARYFQSDSVGTEVHLMKTGIDNLLNDYSIQSVYSGIWQAPDFYEMRDSLQVNQALTLLLGFWWWDGANWWREGGHFVTVAGMKAEALKMALSDPARDEAELGWPGRIRPPEHPLAPHADTLHNDLLYVSHDIYQCQLQSAAPGNTHWQLNDYLEPDPDFPRQFTGANFPAEFLPYYQPAPPETAFVTTVEYAVMICSRQEHWWWEASYPDYAPRGMPDFDQKQDNWINPTSTRFSFSGPTAVANSFWWLDSKLNLPTGSMGDGMDQCPLVRDYLGDLPPFLGWDDHDLANVNHQDTPWSGAGPPPATSQPFIPGYQMPGSVSNWGELVERLAWDMDTDGRRTAESHAGTKVQTMVSAIQDWFASETYSNGSTLSDSLCVMKWQKPTFALVESLVERHENVILLLGFWFQKNLDWRRVGGNYVTVAGINPVKLMVSFSDPFFDNAETGAPGEVLSGFYIPHTPVPHTDSVLHNDPGNVSHDIYSAKVNNFNPAGRWWINDYPVNSHRDSLMNVFYMQNVPDELVSFTRPYISGYAINTVVEYAVLIDQLDYRGDVNKNGSVDIGDVVFLINYLFRGQSAPDPISAGDVTCDQMVNISDIVYIMNYLFRNWPTSRCCGP